MREERPAEGEYRNSIGMRLVSLPAGEFWMGSADGAGARADETPRHRVRLTRPFSLGACEVTAGQYARVLGRAAEGDPDLPAVNVSWDDAVAFCRALSALPDEKAAGRIYRLPTEAEWEYACRAGTTTAYHTGDHLSSRQAQFGQAGPWAVGQGAPNAWGLYDLHGNVWEWCFDAYTADYYRHAPPADPRGLSGGPTRVLRGGGWDAPAADCRSAARRAARPGMRHPAVGFRVAVAE
jgi:formylglycine-generating enzyme required for sulfatase activity